jgi:hypothetical protein
MENMVHIGLTDEYIYIYIYIYVHLHARVCVCVCVYDILKRLSKG